MYLADSVSPPDLILTRESLLAMPLEEFDLAFDTLRARAGLEVEADFRATAVLPNPARHVCSKCRAEAAP